MLLGLLGREIGPPTDAAPAGEVATVQRVVDGDTIAVTIGVTTATVRLIGVDTPETVAPGRPVDCYGPEASAFTKSALTGQQVVYGLVDPQTARQAVWDCRMMARLA